MSNKPFFTLLLSLLLCLAGPDTHAQQKARLGVEFLPGIAMGSLPERRDPLALDYGLSHRMDPRFGAALRITAERSRSAKTTVFAGIHAGYQRMRYVIQHKQRGLIVTAQDGVWNPNYQGWPYLNVESDISYYDLGATAGIRYALHKRWRLDADILLSFTRMAEVSARFEEKPLRRNEPDFGHGIQRTHSPSVFNIAPEASLSYLLPLPNGRTISAGVGYGFRLISDEIAPFYTPFKRQAAFVKIGYVLH